MRTADPPSTSLRDLAFQVLRRLVQAADRRPDLLVRGCERGDRAFLTPIPGHQRLLVASQLVDRALDSRLRPVDGPTAGVVRLESLPGRAVQVIDDRCIELALTKEEPGQEEVDMADESSSPVALRRERRQVEGGVEAFDLVLIRWRNWRRTRRQRIAHRLSVRPCLRRGCWRSRTTFWECVLRDRPGVPRSPRASWLLPWQSDPARRRWRCS